MDGIPPRTSPKGRLCGRRNADVDHMHTHEKRSVGLLPSAGFHDRSQPTKDAALACSDATGLARRAWEGPPLLPVESVCIARTTPAPQGVGAYPITPPTCPPGQ